MDHCEEQEMEAEALEAIFDTAFRIVKPDQPFVWSVKLLPVDCDGDEEEEAKQNHVALNLIVTLPLDYPDSLPELDVEIIKGLAEEQRRMILDLATDEAESNAGMPAVYAVCEAVKGWLADNNVRGQDDTSMYAQMMRRAKEEERSKAQAERVFESQKKKEELTEAEKEEAAVLKRRAEGTPCNAESFAAWLIKFEEEMELRDAEKAKENESSKKKTAEKKADYSERKTGFEQFSGSSGLMNMEAIEAALDAAEEGHESGDDVEVDGVDQELFDDDDDLDDLDFDDDSDDDIDI